LVGAPKKRGCCDLCCCGRDQKKGIAGILVAMGGERGGEGRVVSGMIRVKIEFSAVWDKRFCVDKKAKERTAKRIHLMCSIRCQGVKLKAGVMGLCAPNELSTKGGGGCKQGPFEASDRPD